LTDGLVLFGEPPESDDLSDDNGRTVVVSTVDACFFPEGFLSLLFLLET